MKRNIMTLLITVFAMLQATAQTYDNLWKQADIIAQKDQPKSEIGVSRCLQHGKHGYEECHNVSFHKPIVCYVNRKLLNIQLFNAKIQKISVF